MSYVAEPYLHIADQVLTALTGGVIREAHRFFPNANAFSFELDPDKVIADTIRVIGQANKAFFAFQEGRDFIVDADGLLRFIHAPGDENVPADKAVWPDEGSEFFIAYYHTESWKAPLTDRNIGSLTRTLGEAFARELAVLRKQMELVYKSGFVDTAEGSALDMVVALIGISRKGREFARGSVCFFRDSPAPADIFIPEGTRVSTALNPPVTFTTCINKTLRRGQLSVEVDIRAETKGPVGIVPEKTITVINQSILGISGVTNEASTVYGNAAESDAELRSRAKKVIEMVGKATPRAIISSLTGINGLKENDIKIVEELQLRQGVVQVFVAREPNPDLAQEVNEAILNTRAAGIRVEHNLAIALPVSPHDTLPSDDTRDEGTTDDITEGEDFQLPIECTITIFPDNPRLTGAEQKTIRKSVKNVISSYVDASAIGGVLIYNQIVADLMAISGVLDLILMLKCKGDTSGKGKRNIQIPQGRRAVIVSPESDIIVNFSGAPVNFDFYIKVTPKGGKDFADIKKDIQKEIKEKLTDYFASNPIKISSDELMDTLGVSDLYTILESDMAWTAEYDQAGLIIREQGGPDVSTTVTPGDRTILKNVNVEKKIEKI